ncbi:MAG TPA: bifunctional N-acetylglucosamine-1-phosphate uridyltransferase/glucosamine-1-phosphate acetyltransferase, partial [Planctomycetes bacterium]|nr:bifunctional N-acetylglucosamine-1-phosphate uridyltransferase/glucosamine-1-phosphate acetyltransferase [Planctomycetota bacterium]
MSDKFSAIVLAAGRGTRMHSGLPKLLHPMLGLPLLDHLLRALGSADCSDIVVVTGHKGKQIEEAFSGRGLR